MSQRMVISLGRWGVLLLILALWQWGWTFHEKTGWPMPTIFDPFFISTPSEILERFLEMGCLKDQATGSWAFEDPDRFRACMNSPQGSLWTNTGATLRNTFWGFVVGVGSGAVVGILLGRSTLLAKICEPYIVAINSLPRVALVPLIITVCGLGDLSKIVTALALVFFVVFFNTFEGVRSVDRDYVNAARFLGATNWQVTRTIYIPSALAWVFASLTPAVSFALIGVIVGEFIGAQRGLGKVIIESETALQVADMMVALFVLMITGIALVAIVRMVERRLLRWQRHHSEAQEA